MGWLRFLATTLVIDAQFMRAGAGNPLMIAAAAGFAVRFEVVAQRLQSQSG